MVLFQSVEGIVDGSRHIAPYMVIVQLVFFSGLYGRDEMGVLVEVYFHRFFSPVKGDL